MKKFLLSLATLLGMTAFTATADVAELSFANATDIDGTAGSNTCKYQPVNSFKLGDFSFTTKAGEGALDSQQPAFYATTGDLEKIATLRIYSSKSTAATQYTSTIAIQAPANVKMTEVSIIYLSGKKAGEFTCDAGTVTSTSADATVTGISADKVVFTQSGGNIQLTGVKITYEKTAVEPVDFSSIVAGVFPDEESISDMWESMVGANLVLTQAVTINPACTEAAVMTKDGAAFGTALLNTDAMVVIGGTSGLAEAGQSGTEIMMVFDVTGSPAAGVYKMSIPAGYFLVNGVPTTAYEHTWTVTGSPVVSTPVPFDTLIDTVYPGDNEAKEYWDAMVTVMYTLKGNVTYTGAPVTMTKDGAAYGFEKAQSQSGGYDETDNTSMYGFLFSEEAATDGLYTINIPAGAFTTSDGKSNEAYTHSWRVGEAPAPTYTLTPADGAVETQQTMDIYVDFGDGASVKANGTVADVKMEKADGTPMSLFGLDILGGHKADFFCLGFIDYGTWTVTIPAGFFTVNDVVFNKEIKWSFTFEKKEVVKPVVDPAEGTVTPEQVKTITLTFPESSTVEAGEEYGYMCMLQKADDMMAGSTMYTSTAVGGNILLTAPENAVIADGNYILTVGAGTYKLNGVANEAFELNYTVSAGGVTPELTFTMTPAEGASVDAANLLDIYLTVGGAQSVAVNGPATLTKGERTITLQGVLVGGTMIDYMITNDVPDAGEWTMTVPANSLNINGAAYDKDITWKFTVTEAQTPELPTPTYDPASGTVKSEQLKTVTVTYPEGTVIELGSNYYITLADPLGMEFLYSAVAEGNKVTLTLDESAVVAEGQYTLNIYMGAWTVNGNNIDGIAVPYTVDNNVSIDVIGLDANAMVNVYTIEGVCVLRNASAAEISNLAAGMYIINGKKVIIRK